MEMILDGSCDLLEYYGDSPEVAGMVLPGDVRKTLELLDDQSVQCVVTSLVELIGPAESGITQYETVD